MNYGEAKAAVLEYLYNGYRKNPSEYYNVTEVCKNQGLDPHDVGQYLDEHGWVKNSRYSSDSFECQISISGIHEVDPDYLDDNKDKILTALCRNETGSQSILDILGWDSERYFYAKDLSTYLQIKGYVKEEPSPENDVVVVLSDKGLNYCSANREKNLHL